MRTWIVLADGNEAFESGRWSDAIRLYQDVLRRGVTPGGRKKVLGKITMARKSLVAASTAMTQAEAADRDGKAAGIHYSSERSHRIAARSFDGQERGPGVVDARDYAGPKETPVDPKTQDRVVRRFAVSRDRARRRQKRLARHIERVKKEPPGPSRDVKLARAKEDFDLAKQLGDFWEAKIRIRLKR